MTKQTEEKPVGSAAAEPTAAGMTDTSGEPGKPAPETTVPGDPAQRKDHQPSTPERGPVPAHASEVAVARPSEPAPVPVAAPASAAVPAPVSETGPVAESQDVAEAAAVRPSEPRPASVASPAPAVVPAPVPETEPASEPQDVPEAAAVRTSEPVPVPVAAPASAAVSAPVSETGPASEPQDVPEAAAVRASEPVPVPVAAPASAAVSAPVPETGPAPEPQHAPAAAAASPSAPAAGPASAAVPAPVPETAPAPEPQHVPDGVALLDSGTGTDPAAAPEPAPKDRRVLRAALRWTAALLTFAAFGAGSAYGIAGMERTDVPGLGTVSDGRWDFPVLTKAPLPSGSPGPLAPENKAGSHYADLRALVLPAPEGATVDKALSGTDGWLPTKDLLSEYAEKEDREEFGTKLSENGLRHIAARGWTTPDGTRTRIYLLQFDTAAVVDDLFGRDIAPYGSPGYELGDAPDSVSDEAFPDAARIHDITASVYVESKPYGKEQARHAYIGAGDVLALVVQSRKGTANPVPFQQTVTLQSQLLG